jgi:predicted nuclease of predicted toxin-antitoxin system
LAAAIRLYLDENLSPKIALQLQRRGIDIVSVHELGLTGDSDENHLNRAAGMGRVLVTADVDFLVMAAEGISHAGIVFGVQENLSIGDWVNSLELIATVYTAEEMNNHVEYL